MKMGMHSDSTSPTDALPSVWTTGRLREFLKEKTLSVSGLKHKLISRVSDFIETGSLESELDVKELQVEPSVSFVEL